MILSYWRSLLSSTFRNRHSDEIKTKVSYKQTELPLNNGKLSLNLDFWG